MLDDNINTLKRALRIGVYSNLEAIATLVDVTKIDSLTLTKFLSNNTQEERLAVLGAVSLHAGEERASVVRDAIDAVLNKKLAAFRMSVRRDAYRDFLAKADRDTLEEIANIITSKGDSKNKIEEYCLSLIDAELSVRERKSGETLEKLIREGRISDIRKEKQK